MPQKHVINTEAFTPNGARKALWRKTGLPDNFIDDKFLESLVVNATVAKRSYWRVVWSALAVNQRLCVVAIVSSTAYLLHQRMLNASILLVSEGLLLLSGTALHGALHQGSNKLNVIRYGALWRSVAARTMALLLLTCLMSPIYASLTASISSDTVVACTAVLSIAHLYLYDYRRPSSGPGPTFRGSVALACALCASVLMASRMHGYDDVIALNMLSLEAYVMSPALHYTILEHSPGGHLAFSLALAGAAALTLASASVVLTSALLCTLACVGFICPMWLVRIQKFKAQINGPWDEAIPKISLQQTH